MRILHQTRLCYPMSQWSVISAWSPTSPFTDNWKQALSPLGKEHGNYVVPTPRSATDPTFCRFVLSDTQELHEHILTMSQRIRQLEEALTTATNQHTASGTHPLLSDDLLAIKFGPESRTNGDLSTDSHEDESETDRCLSAPGSFFRCPDGSTKYFGPSGGSGEHYIPLHFGLDCLRRNQETVLLVSPSTSVGSRLLRLHSDWGRVDRRLYGWRLWGGPWLSLHLRWPQSPRPDVHADGIAPG